MGDQVDWMQQLDSLSPEAIGGLVVDGEFHVRAVSDALVDRLGVPGERLLDSSALDLFHPADIGRAAAVVGRSVSDQRSVAPGVYRLAGSPGMWDIYELAVVGVAGTDDGIVLLEFSEADSEAKVHSLLDDVAELTQLLVEPVGLRRSFREISDFAERNIDRLSLAITIFAEDGTAATFCERELDSETVEQNNAAHPLSLPPHVVEAHGKAKIRAWRAEDEVGTIMAQRPDRMTMVLLDMEDNLLGYVDAFRSTHEVPSSAEWRIYRLVLQMLRAVMVSAQLDLRLTHLRSNDALTGLTNRHTLLQRMAVADLDKSGLVVVNLDGFGWVNKSMGFAAGDTVLASVAASILSVTPAGAVVTRLAGDEFLIWVPSPRNNDEVFRLAEKLRKAIAVPIDNADRRGRTRCSIGATRVAAGESADAAIHRAVAAMTESKDAGGDRVTHA